jgi:hypothetical protein
MWKEQINRLSKIIYNYYPIGFPYLNLSYVGFREYENILKGRISALQNNEDSPWKKLLSVFQEKYGGKAIEQYSIQFPSYSIQIELHSEASNNFTFSRKIVVIASLLCKYYTVFFEDFYNFNHNETYKGVPPFYRILFSKEKGLNNATEVFTKTVALVKNNISEYDYISHKLLFDYKVFGGYPYTENQESALPSYPIFSFLFDGFFQLDNLEIIE